MLHGEEDDLAYEEFSDDDIVSTGKKLRDDDVDSEDSYEIGMNFVIKVGI